ncbi:MAG: septum site-determining protein MinC [Firmicutes bacterium]|nr:septum site-determining protein MinC [Bacillota bacterium]
MSDLVTFKGDKAGLRIILSAEAELSEVFSQLAAELSNNRSFFSEGSSARVYTEGRILQPAELAELAQILVTHGMTLTQLEVKAPAKSKSRPNLQPLVSPPVGAKVIKRTLRSGMKVSHDGDIVVLGDVNPGSEVIASGDIIVFGTLRGVVHAGATGNLAARVIALRLAPTQLRIANLIARAPDEMISLPDRPEVARVQDGVVLIEEFAS